MANAPLTSMLKKLSDPIINQTIGSYVEKIIGSDNYLNNWEFCPNKEVLATLLQDFLFFINLPANSYKITEIENFRQTLHTKSGNST